VYSWAAYLASHASHALHPEVTVGTQWLSLGDSVRDLACGVEVS
jgi:hypothetical protein